MDKQKAGGTQGHAGPDLRRSPSGGEPLELLELEPSSVFDHAADAEPVRSFGPVRETCPHCPGEHLTLVLRQDSVRRAHLFCEHCGSCFDARYANGRCALTI